MKTVITGLGMATSLGGLVAGSAAVRAGITRPVPLTHASLPAEGPEPQFVTGHSLRGFTDGYYFLGRWLRLAHAAIEDLRERVSLPAEADVAFWSRTGLIVAVPDDIEDRVLTSETIDDDYLIDRYALKLAGLATLPVDRAAIRIIRAGYVGAIAALRLAGDEIAKDGWDRVFVVATDSLVDGTSLGWLARGNRLKTPDRPVGLHPGGSGRLSAGRVRTRPARERSPPRGIDRFGRCSGGSDLRRRNRPRAGPGPRSRGGNSPAGLGLAPAIYRRSILRSERARASRARFWSHAGAAQSALAFPCQPRGALCPTGGHRGRQRRGRRLPGGAILRPSAALDDDGAHRFAQRRRYPGGSVRQARGRRPAMVSEFLYVHGENAEAILDESLPFLVSKQLNYRELLAVCENYRIRGIVHLLLDLDPAELHRSLHDSGQAFLFGLKAVPPEQMLVSDAVPLYDAMACNAFALAGEIAGALRLQWQPDVEYEEDFLYLSFLCRQYLIGAPAGEALPALQRFGEIGPEEPRFKVCQALVAKDAQAFAAAFAEFLSAYQERCRIFVEAERLSSEAAATLPYFCTEGLALLRLAERMGLPTEGDYPTVPGLARGDWNKSFDAQSWQRRKLPTKRP